MVGQGKTIALIGNPNSGKSSLFNNLTGLRQHVSNFPGVTVDKKSGTAILPNGNSIKLVDLPGLYSLFPNSTDEKLVVKILVNPQDTNHPDLIVYVADINNLERHMLLATQIADLKIPMIFVLNMIDLYNDEGNTMSIQALEDYINVPIIATSSKTGENIEKLKLEIQNFHKTDDISRYLAKGPFYKFTEIESNTVKEVNNIRNKDTSPYQQKLEAHHFAWLEHLNTKEKESISSAIKKTNFENIKSQISETMHRYNGIQEVVKKTLYRSSKVNMQSTTDKIDRIITHRIAGPILFFSIMILMFQAVFSWAEYPMDLIENLFAFMSSGARNLLGDGWFSDLFIDGIIAGLGGVLIFIPQIFILFLLIAVLEETGYMSRAVFMFDNLFQRFGLNGRSMVALVSSGACAIPAIMSTRTISNWKERLITILVAPLISCAARLPVYAALVGFVVPNERVGIFNLQGLAFMGLYLIGIVAAFVSAFVFKKILKNSSGSYLMIELPQYKPPIWKNVFLTVWEKVLAFVLSAGKIILLISIILWFLASFGPKNAMDLAETSAIKEQQELNLNDAQYDNLLASNKIEASFAGHIGKFIEPAIRPLGFDWKIGIALITSFAAREVFVGTMATIYSIGSEADESTLREKMAAELRSGTNLKMYDRATSLSLLIFYVFAMQCMSTLAVTKRETKSWKWPIVQLTYMTALAYFGSLIVYQLLS